MQNNDPVWEAQRSLEGIEESESPITNKTRRGTGGGVLLSKAPRLELDNMVMYGLLIVLLVGIAFGLGYLIGSKSYNNSNIMMQPIEESEHILTDQVNTDVVQAEPSPGPAATTSAVLKAPTPEEIRNRRDQEAMAELLENQEKAKREGGSYAM